MNGASAAILTLACALCGLAQVCAVPSAVTEAKRLLGTQPFEAKSLQEAAARRFHVYPASENGNCSVNLRYFEHPSKPLDKFFVRDAVSVLEGLAEALAVLHEYDCAAACRLAVLRLHHLYGSFFTAQETTFAHVGVIDSSVLNGRYDAAAETAVQAIAYWGRVNAHLVNASANSISASGVSSPATTRAAYDSTYKALLRVQSSIKDCVGNTTDALHLFAVSVGIRVPIPGSKWSQHPKSHPFAVIKDDVGVKLALDYLQLLWRNQPPHTNGLVDEGWLAAEVARVTGALLRKGSWTTGMQLPKHFVPNLLSKPFHNTRADFPALARIRTTLEAYSTALQSEFRTLQASGLLEYETECIHDASTGDWKFFTVNGHWHTHRDGDGCATASPVACSVMRAIADLPIPHLRVLRGGYSVVKGGSFLRPHCGVTNTQLKFHLGLDIPTGQDGGACAHLTVGNVTKAWKEGKTLFFDDSWLHSVRSDCDRERVIFQLVIRHPDLPAAPSDAASRFGSCKGH
jgi:hypothetical protein